MAPDNKAGSALATRPAQELLTKDGRPIDHVITRVEELVEQLDVLRSRAHVISPVLSTTAMAPGFGAVLSIVKVDTSQHSRDFYPLKSRQQEKNDRGEVVKNEELFGPSKLLINRIGAAAGVTWLPFPYSLRVDDRKIQNFAEFTSTMEFWAPDGKRIRHSGTKAIDLRDGSPLAQTMTPAQLRQARPFIVELAETKSQLRALRKLGISQNYTLKELEKPFVVVQLSFQPDMSDPTIKMAVTKHYLGIADTLYGPAPHGHELEAGDDRPGLPPSSARDLPPELGGTGQPAASETPAAANAPREASFDDEPEAETDDRPRFAVLHVLEPSNGDWPIELGGGRVVLTNVREVAKAASRAGKDGKAITLTTTGNRVDELIVLDEPAPTTAPAADASSGGEPPDTGLRYVKDVKEGVKTGKNASGPWSLSIVVVNTGEEFSTFSATHVATAKEARAKSWPVQIVEKDNSTPDRRNIETITLIDPRQGTLPGVTGEKY